MEPIDGGQVGEDSRERKGRRNRGIEERGNGGIRNASKVELNLDMAAGHVFRHHALAASANLFFLFFGTHYDLRLLDFHWISFFSAH